MCRRSRQAILATKDGGAAPAAAPVAIPAAAAAAAAKQYTMEEVALHNTEESCWFVHEGKVGGCSAWLWVLAAGLGHAGWECIQVKWHIRPCAYEFHMPM